MEPRLPWWSSGWDSGLPMQGAQVPLGNYIPCATAELQNIDDACMHANLLQSCPTLCDPMNCSPPGSSVHGILQAKTLEWVAIPFSRGSSQCRDQTWDSCIAGRFFTIWATREAQMELVSNAHTNLTKWKFTLKIIQPYSLIQCFSQVWHYG